jgi:triosephosphate isomerase
MAGNWKMNKDHLEATHHVQKLAWLLRDANHDFGAVEVAVIPPFTALRSVQTLVQADDLKVRYGAQDISAHDGGAYTGDVSGTMLSALGCSYVVVGHSERRAHHGETDLVVASKAGAAHRHGLVPIVCVGELLDVRDAGGHVGYTVDQLAGSLAGLTADQVARTVIAYEPVWAIGTGRVCDPDDCQEVAAALRSWVSDTHGEDTARLVRILYGGSVKPTNIASTMRLPDVDGALVGGASLQPEDFAAIVRYREHPG